MSVELVSRGEPAFDQDEVRHALVELDGNVTKTARKLGLEPERLRSLVDASDVLRAAMDEALARAVDEAVDVVIEGLRDEASFQNRYYSAKEILRSDAGRRRGFGREAGATATLELKNERSGGTTITLKWLEPAKEA